MSDVARLEQLIKAGYPCISITTHEEAEALETIRTAVMNLQRGLLLWSIGYGVREGLLADSPAEPETDKPETGLCHFAMAQNNPVCVALDINHHLTSHGSELTLRILRDIIHRIEINEGTLILINSDDNLPPVIKSYCTAFELSLPTEDQLEQLVVDTLRDCHRKSPIEVGITRRGMNAIVKNLRGLTRRQARQLVCDCVADDSRFDDQDVNRVLAGKRKVLKADGLLEYIETPLDLDEIGGMKNLKRWLRHRKASFKDDAANFGLRPPRGVLMLGVQGAGKSLCAKAIATAWQQPLLRMDPGSLYNKYIGESEQNLRKALDQTELMSPVILWIDEIEKAFASASGQSNDGGLSRRMFGSLLTWMQEHEHPVFLVATANDIESLPPELLRKGRFDEIFFVGLPREEARRAILKIHLKKRGRKPEDFDLEKLVALCDGYSGAEIEQAIVSALHQAYENKGKLTTDMIAKAIEDSPPLSVTMAEKIEALYAWAEDRTVPAD